MPTLAQRSFSGGELSPDLFARCDTTKYATGLRTLRNFFVKRSGGASNRPSTKFIGEVKDSTKATRLLKFIFNNTQTYQLEFGDQYMRVIREGEYLTDVDVTITGVSSASQAVFTYSGSDQLTNGQEVYISGIAGALGQYLNNRNFKVSDVDTMANTFKLKLMDGTTYFATTGLPAYTTGGTASRIYEITTQYADEDLSVIKFDQAADVLTLTHPDYPTAELTRSGHTSWTIDYDIFDNLRGSPAKCDSDNPWSSGTEFIQRYAITTLFENGEESIPGYDSQSGKSVSSVTKTNPAVVTHTSFLGGTEHISYRDGDIVEFTALSGMPELENRFFTITIINSTSFSLNGIDATGYTTFVSGNVRRSSWCQDISSAALSGANKNTITWFHTTGATGYNVYREKDGVFGLLDFVGEAFSSFAIQYTDDATLEPNVSITPPIPNERFVEEDDYPSAVAYIQQRRAFASTNNDPEIIALSRIGSFSNFSTHRPVLADDAITFFLVGSRVDRVRHLVDLGAMVIFTGGSEWKAAGQSEVLIAGEINTNQQSSNGCSDLRPIIVNKTILYVQERGSIVRDFNFDFSVDGYDGDDLTTYSNHLVDGHTLVSWDYQKVPHSIVWAARDDGILLGLTYNQKQQILAWHRHDFENGLVEDVSVTPEGDYDAIYLIIKRVINGRIVRYVERMEPRFFIDIRDANFCDSGLYYDGRGNGSITMTLSGGSTWVAGQNLTCTASSSTFSSSSIGKSVIIQVDDEFGVTHYVRCEITAYTSATVVTVQPDILVHTSLRSVALTDWAIGVDTLDGLWHLEGQDVAIIADGFVIASPNNPDYDTFTVTNGRITLDNNYGVIRIGLPITSDIETLNIDSPSTETVEDKSKLITAVTVWLQQTRGAFFGPRDPSEKEGWTGDLLENLEELKQREYESDNEPTRMVTEPINKNFDGQWNSNGRVFIRQIDPLPITINAIAPAGMVPFQSGGG